LCQWRLASSWAPSARRSASLLAGRRPYDEVSIGEIAAAAGVSKGLLYHYFPTKKDFVPAALGGFGSGAVRSRAASS